MLPPVVDEGLVSIFKFWYGDRIQDGLYYRNELYYRVATVGLEQRARLYHHACRVSQTSYAVVTMTQIHCSLWVSLRSSATAVAAHSFVYLPPTPPTGYK